MYRHYFRAPKAGPSLPPDLNSELLRSALFAVAPTVDNTRLFQGWPSGSHSTGSPQASVPQVRSLSTTSRRDLARIESSRKTPIASRTMNGMATRIVSHPDWRIGSCIVLAGGAEETSCPLHSGYRHSMWICSDAEVTACCVPWWDLAGHCCQIALYRIIRSSALLRHALNAGRRDRKRSARPTRRFR